MKGIESYFKVSLLKDLTYIICRMYCNDCNFLKNFQDEYNALEKHESKAINKFVNKHAGQLISEYFDN